ncbi:TRAP transporter small permease subunit [Stappia taiwanensis]|uniref:TRAP transporter small permease protein n=1 Tax=Stappia taiwanensis TaxID=992267 RepID=A0A838XVG2_9HYPH|nr:TRAP transporter small permease [Stappia taiwanensis]MBA4612476.1 TRAP transporter small permease subunit [Stappia taiwanensis]GGF05652.1 TRAP transporter small permease protein [Stappia taiwanensis]
MITQTLAALRRINHVLAVATGVVLLVTAGFVILDITLRQFALSFGGSDEISGYVMAGLASWGLSYALTELAHVRIDLIRLQLRQGGRALMDLFAMTVMAGTVTLIAMKSWPVLEKTLTRGSRANTPLETPLWIPQAVWFSGWVWFAVSSCILVLLAAILLFRRDFAGVDRMIGTVSEADLEAGK